MTKAHETVSREAWLAARKALMAEEKALLRRSDAIAEKRRALPWVRVDEAYIFTSAEGQVTLEELFAGRSQLVVYHFMFAEDWEKGCKSCSFWADQFDASVPHLRARDVSFAAVSTAAPATLDKFKERMGWAFRWVSSAGTTFNHDYGVTFTDEQIEAGTPLYNFGTQPPHMRERHGLSVFIKDDEGNIFHTYSVYSRGTDPLNATYRFLDLVPKGRDEAHLDYPMTWVKLHDEYEA